MADKVTRPPDKYDLWLADVLNMDPAEVVARRRPDPTAAVGAAAASKAKPNTPELFASPQANPFDAPEAQLEIEKLTVSKLQELTVEQAQNVRSDFLTAIANVKSKKKAEADAEETKREQMVTLVITVMLLPAGPVVEAAANGLAGPQLQSTLADFIANNATSLESKFGSRGAQIANKSFDLITDKALSSLAEKFDAGKAKKALEAGVDKLKDKSIKFAASSDKGKCIEAYLDAVGQSANNSMHNLTDVILTTKTYSEALAYYKLFHTPMQAIYETLLAQQVEDMLSEIKEPLAQHGEETTISATEGGTTTGLDEIVKVDFYGRKRLAHVSRTTTVGLFLSGKPSYGFQKWVTPDMEETAAKLVKEEVSADVFKGQHVPDPQCEPGERVVSVKVKGAERLMLIGIEDEGIFWREYGVRRFKQWAEGEEDERLFRSRGSLQIGGINEVPLASIKDVPAG